MKYSICILFCLMFSLGMALAAFGQTEILSGTLVALMVLTTDDMESTIILGYGVLGTVYINSL